MIVPSDKIKKENNAITFTGGINRIRLFLPQGDPNESSVQKIEGIGWMPSNSNTFIPNPTEIFVQEIDGLGNVRTSDSFKGFDGFWEAVSLFEKKIEESMGWKEVVGFEVGMIIKLEKDTKKYKKGTFLVITEVDANGKASKYEKVDSKKVDKISKSKFVVNLRKAQGLEAIMGKGISSVSELKADKTYQFGLNLNSQLVIPTNETIDSFSVGEDVVIDADKGGGEGQIQQLLINTDDKGDSMVCANIRLDDGALGCVPLKDLLKKP